MIKEITFDEILPIWRDKLWIGRKSTIKPTNGIVLMGGYDKQIETNRPSFFGAFINDELIGVNSGFGTGDCSYRSRGLYVSAEHRRKNISQMLLIAVQEQALLEGNNMLWSMPRETALLAYIKFGFKQASEFFDENVEFGPNCYVVKYLGGKLCRN